MPLNDINLALRDLIKTGNTEDSVTFVDPDFKTIDIYPIFEHAFNDKAKLALNNKAHETVYQYNEPIPFAHTLVMLGKLGIKTCARYKDAKPADMYIRKFDLVYFAGSRATKDKLSKAIENVIATVNHVADKNFTRASMLQLSMMEIMPISSSEPEYIVVSYITLTQEGADYVKQYMPNSFVSEGGLPVKVE